MDYKNIPILHVDGSLSEYIDKQGVLHKIGGIGGYAILNGKVIDKFYKILIDVPFIEQHEDYAVIEGIKWMKNKNFSTVKVKTDSLGSVNLFSNQKKAINKSDKFFLTQFLMLEFLFEVIEVSYHSRTEDDLSHKLSRMYLKEIPKGVKRVHHADTKSKKTTDLSNQEYLDKEVSKILLNSIRELI